MIKRFWRLIPFVLFALLVLFFWRGLSLDPKQLPLAQLGRPLPSFELPLLSEKKGERFTPLMMRGHVALLNVWASWCATCSEEQVFLLKLSQSGVLIYGLNYKDSPHDAQRWLKEWGNPYQLIGSDRLGKAAIDLGVYGAPETFLIDKAGVIQHRHVGALDELAWQKEFLPRIQQLERAA